MQYLGGKSRLAKPLAAFLLERFRARPGRVFVEPFCGALNITAAMEPAGYRVASDLNPYLLTLYRALRDGWVPPDVDEELYARVSANRDVTDPLTAFVGYGCAFGGKWFGGFARNAEGKRYSDTARRGLERKLAACNQVVFAECAYDRLNIDAGCLVYADPPYAGTTEYGAAKGFDSGKFWDVVRRWSRAGAEVYVSEYAAPSEFQSVWDASTHGGQLAKGANREHLFTNLSRASDKSPIGERNTTRRV